MSKRVLIVGGTGFLGYHALLELRQAGWETTAAGLPPAPPAGFLPSGTRLLLQDIHRMPDADLVHLFKGHEALVFAAGLDDRHTPAIPAYPKFFQANVQAPLRLFQLAAQSGIRRAVVLGSYFAHFDRVWPAMRLAEVHPYIRSRVEQERALLGMPGLETCVLELPYIFGSLQVPGWRPLWAPLVGYIRSSRTLLYMRGGTACISARTVGRAVLAALERGRPGQAYPIGGENLSWTQMLTRLARADGREVRVKLLPTRLIDAAMKAAWLLHRIQGREGGLDLRRFAPLQTAETFLDPQAAAASLGYQPDDLDTAFRETVAACAS